MSMIELKQLKKEFINLCKQVPPKTIDDITDIFIGYLEFCLLRNT